MALNIEQYLPPVLQAGGLYTALPVTISGAVSITGATTLSGAIAVTSSSASALAVGANGSTNPVLKIDASTASVATGISVTGAAAASGVAVAAISSGTNENLKIDAKGSGTITLGGTSTGNIVLGRAATGVSVSVTGVVTAFSGTAVPAGGTAGTGFTFTSTSNLGVFVGSGAPTLSAAQGSIYLRTDGSSTSTRMYVNTNGTTGWTAVTTAT